MKQTLAFFLFLLGCLMVGALLTKPILDTGWLHQPPHRVLGRLAQVSMLLGFWPFLRILGIAHRDLLGYGPPWRVLVRSALRGWLVGIGILSVLVSALVFLGIRIPESQGIAILALGTKALQALAGGLVIAILEETFFRGALYGWIRRTESLGSALFWSAFLYALVHFMKPHPLPDSGGVDWETLGHLVAQVFTEPVRWQHLDSFVALVFVGIFLGLVRERTGHLGVCIGLHSGWVFVIQLTRYLSDGDPQSPFGYLVGTYDGVIGWLAAAWIGLLSLGYLAFTRWQRAATRPASSARSAAHTR